MSKREIFTCDLKIGDKVWSLSGFPMGIVTEVKSTIFYCNGEQGYAIRHDSKVLVEGDRHE